MLSRPISLVSSNQLLNSSLQSILHRGKTRNHILDISCGIGNEGVTTIDGIEVRTVADFSLEAHLSGVAPLLTQYVEGILNSVARNVHLNPVSLNISLRTLEQDILIVGGILSEVGAEGLISVCFINHGSEGSARDETVLVGILPQ